MKITPWSLFALTSIVLLLAGCARNQEQLAHHAGARQFVFGDMSVTEIIDSPLRFDASMWPEVEKYPERLAEMPGGKYDTYIKTFLVTTGDRIVLIDGGAGKEHYVTKGHTEEFLKSRNISPEDVTDILRTHLDIDHIGGLIAGKNAVYPNAALHVSLPEYEAWTNDSGLINRLPEQKRLAGLVLAAYQTRLRLFCHGATILPGIVALEAAGHTPGHTVYELAHEGDGMLFAGDFMHIATIQLRTPEYSTVWDASPQAGATRRRILERLGNLNLLLAGMHIRDIGHVRRAADGGFILVPMN